MDKIKNSSPLFSSNSLGFSVYFMALVLFSLGLGWNIFFFSSFIAFTITDRISFGGLGISNFYFLPPFMSASSLVLKILS